MELSYRVVSVQCFDCNKPWHAQTICAYTTMILLCCPRAGRGVAIARDESMCRCAWTYFIQKASRLQRESTFCSEGNTVVNNERYGENGGGEMYVSV